MNPGSWTALILLVLSGVGILIKVLALGLVPRNRKPSTGLAWLMLVILSPWIGLVAFAFFGRTSVGSKRRHQQADANRQIAARTTDLPDMPVGLVGPEYLATSVHLNRALGSMPMTGGNSIEYLPHYETTIAKMADAVRGAQEHVLVEFYISAWDDVTDPLLDRDGEAAERGVEVQLLFDHLGVARHPGLQGHPQAAERDPDRVARDAPDPPAQGHLARPDLRNHRKLLVVDGRVGFMGSQNLIEPGYNKPKNHKPDGDWVELMVRVEGPVVAALEVVFAIDWYAETDESCYVRDVGPADGDLARRHDGVRAPGGAERSRLSHREQPAAVHHPDLRRPAAALADQPLLRARRVAAVRRHHGRPARRRRRAVRQRAVRPVHGRSRAGVVLPGAARGRRQDLPLPGALRSCTPSTSPSTTTSR